MAEQELAELTAKLKLCQERLAGQQQWQQPQAQLRPLERERRELTRQVDDIDLDSARLGERDAATRAAIGVAQALPAALRPLCPRAALISGRRQAQAAKMAEPVETPRRNLTGAVVPAVAVAGLAAFGAMLLVVTNGGDGAKQTSVTRDCIQENVDAVGGPIDLIDANGAHVTQADFAGEPAVIYFGYTPCPDICPTSMYTLAEALGAPGGYDVQPILITVDPERDTPQRMGE